MLLVKSSVKFFSTSWLWMKIINSRSVRVTNHSAAMFTCEDIFEPTHERWLCVVPSVRQSATDGRGHGSCGRRHNSFFHDGFHWAQHVGNTISWRLKRPISSPNRSRRRATTNRLANPITTADVSLATAESAGLLEGF